MVITFDILISFYRYEDAEKLYESILESDASNAVSTIIWKGMLFILSIQFRQVHVCTFCIIDERYM